MVSSARKFAVLLLLSQKVFENDDEAVSLAAPSGNDQDVWIEAINSAGYEYMKKLIFSLRDQLMNKMGHFLPKLALSVPIDSDRRTAVTGEEAFFEFSLRCDGLSVGPGGEEPNTMVVISKVSPQDDTCRELTRTEIELNTCSPVFMKTLCFSSAQISTDTRIKLEARDMSEGVIRRELGCAFFTMRSLTSSPASTLQCSLRDGNGTITITAWQDDSDTGSMQSAEGTELESQLAQNCATSCDKANENHILPPASPAQSRTHTRDHVKQLSVWFGDILTRAYRFPATNGSEIKVHEFLGESKLTYYLPQKLLTIFESEDELMLQRLEDIGKLPKVWENIQTTHLEQFRKSLKLYKERLKYIEEYDGPPFVPSTNMKRLIRHTEFLPTNLHQQRLDVTSEVAPKGISYDTTTCGLFTSFTLRYRQGGLRRLMQQFKEQFAAKFNFKPRLDELWYLLTYVNKLQMDVHSEGEVFCDGAEKGRKSELKSTASQFLLKVRQLLDFCEEDLVQESLETFTTTMTENKNGAIKTKKKRRNSLTQILNFKKHRRKSVDVNMNFMVESWVSLKSLVETLSVNFETKTDKIISKGRGVMREEAELLIQGVLRAVENICRLILNSLAFKIIVETSPNVSLWHTIRFRRNLCYSQGLSALTVGVMSGMSTSIRNEELLEQISKIGILVSFECLLSCFGDEIAMLEDMVAILKQLDDVKFRIYPSNGDKTSMPRLCQVRPYVIMEIPLPPHEFNLLPVDLREGHLIDIHTCMFNVGVNEQATLGEKLGVDELEKHINNKGFEILSQYKEEFLKSYQEPLTSDTRQTLTERMSALKQSVALKKSRNTAILHISDEIARMIRAFRFTCCKSSRDRTSMGITLEQTMILQREHQLAQKVFMRALDCFRTDGVRRANAIKNTGKRHYDFATMRVMALPTLYKPPSGCYRPL
ncbi:inositol polyphosphate-4-phosphatase type I A-like isoform X3 [Lineus longissimus]|uniref:inositol polyphosphate-4-phosphatase type I A-like isoform X3 n=1 Tax=Lineus longissimus TaxID=88925 RepID=UPI002B4ED76F